MNVLIVDNSADIISRFKEMFAEIHTVKAVYSAYTCEEALEQIKKNKPDIIILDLNIPGNDSFKCLSEIKKVFGGTFIALSSREDKTDAYQYKLLGVDYLLDKYHEFEKVPEILLSITKRNE